MAAARAGERVGVSAASAARGAASAAYEAGKCGEIAVGN